MADRNFHLRLGCPFESAKNNPKNLAVEVLVAKEWQAFEPSVETAGFLLFVFALFSCQLRYMRMNSAERDLVLASTRGEITVVAGEFWDVKKVLVSFKSVLKSGQPTPEDIAYIKERMTHCPVSSNIPKSAEIYNDVIFV